MIFVARRLGCGKSNLGRWVMCGTTVGDGGMWASLLRVVTAAVVGSIKELRRQMILALAEDME